VSVPTALVALNHPVFAYDTLPQPTGTLPEVTVTASPVGVGTADTASQGQVPQERLQEFPVFRPAEILETVPGLVVTQHSGEGKANQYFLRGFNLDHGTDIDIMLDNMPVNLRTHAHGQGYADLNFMIPELVRTIDYSKGPTSRTKGISIPPGPSTSTMSTRCRKTSPRSALARSAAIAASPPCRGRGRRAPSCWRPNTTMSMAPGSSPTITTRVISSHAIARARSPMASR
jgi:hypothetical protein